MASEGVARPSVTKSINPANDYHNLIKPFYVNPNKPVSILYTGEENAP